MWKVSKLSFTVEALIGVTLVKLGIRVVWEHFSN